MASQTLRERTIELKALGLCTRCGKRLAEDGYTRCSYCIKKERSRKREERRVHSREEIEEEIVREWARIYEEIMHREEVNRDVPVLKYPKVGQNVTVKTVLHGFGDEGDNSSLVSVVSVHPSHRWFVSEWVIRGNVMRESFMIEDIIRRMP